MSAFTADFTGQVMLVTGANGRLGRAVSRALLDLGATVVPVTRSGPLSADEFPELAMTDAHRAEGIDLTDPGSFNQAVAAVLDRFGRIDGLMHTVGGYRQGRPVQMTPLDDWQALHDLNARSTFVACRAVLPPMLERGRGKIVCVAARSALKADGRSAAYSASKSAVVRLVEAIGDEVCDEGLNVNCVLPSVIDTPENRAAMPTGQPDRWVPPQQIADVMLFLASDAAQAINGAAIPVYGRS